MNFSCTLVLGMRLESSNWILIIFTAWIIYKKVNKERKKQLLKNSKWCLQVTLFVSIFTQIFFEILLKKCETIFNFLYKKFQNAPLVPFDRQPFIYKFDQTPACVLRSPKGYNIPRNRLVYSLNLNQSKSTDYQWNLNESNS